MKHPGYYHLLWRPLLVVSGARVVSPREKYGFDAYSIINSEKMLLLCRFHISSIVQTLLKLRKYN
jgi:hypothetical protein